MSISKQQAENAVNLLYAYCTELRDSVTIFRDEEDLPMAIMVQCPHCAKLFDQFAQLDDAGKERALQSANAGKLEPANEPSEERQNKNNKT
jgi:hypothetical protein